MNFKALMLGVFMCAAYANAASLPKPAVDVPPEKSGSPATAVLAGGCFWCTEAVIEQIDGIGEPVLADQIGMAVGQAPLVAAVKVAALLGQTKEIRVLPGRNGSRLHATTVPQGCK